MGNVFSYEEDKQWKSLTKFKEQRIIYVKDKNINYWIGDNMDRYEKPIQLDQPDLGVGIQAHPPHNYSQYHYLCHYKMD